MKLKFSAWAFCLSFLMGLSAFAQTAAVKDIPTDGDTTISITKGKNTQNEFEITEGTADIAGEPEVLSKTARSSWKKACDEWKQEIKELNKENQVLSLSCSSPNCVKNSTTETVCQSTGKYKVKTRIR